MRRYLVSHTTSTQDLMGEIRQDCPSRAASALARLLALATDRTSFQAELDEWAERGLPLAIEAGGE